MAEIDLADSSPQGTPEPSVDLRQYWRVVLKRRWLILGVFVAVVGLTTAYTLRLPKSYAASASVVIEMAAPKILGNGVVQDVAESSSPSYWYSKEYYETQFNVLRSRGVAERVAQLLLTGRDDQLLGLDRVSSADAREKGLKALESLRAAMRQRPDPGALVLGRVVVEPVKDSRVVRLSVEDRDPVLAAAIANAFAQAYMTHNLASKSVTTSEATESLNSSLPELDAAVRKATDEIAKFKTKNNISGSFEQEQKLVLDRLHAINSNLTDVVILKANAAARSDAIAEIEKNPDEVQRAAQVSDGSAEVIRQLHLREIDARSDCEQLEERMLAEHPKLRDCRAKLAAAQKAYRTELDTVLAKAKADFAKVARTEKNLLKELAEAQLRSAALNSLDSDYQALRRSVEQSQRLFDIAVKSQSETKLSDKTRLNNVTMLDAALPSLSPARPNVRNNVLGGVFAGLLLGLLLAFALEWLDNTVASQEEIEERLGVTFLGIIPSFSTGEKGVISSDLHVFEAPKSAAAECCRAIRTNLLFMSPERPLKSILVTSAGPRDGKTTTAASLAVTMAESGNRVLLVDADLRRPRVHTAFKVPNGAGLSSLVLGEGTLEGLAKSSGVPNLSLLTCGPVPPNPAELLHTQAFKALLAEMTSKFDRVIIDSPPVGAVADSVVMSTLVDGTVLVVKSGSTSRDLARRTVRALRSVKARIFGAVLNDVDLQDRQSGGYYYYSKYGYYYGEPETKDRAAASRTS